MAVKTAREMFYFADDIMAMLGYSKTKAYQIIAELNKELEASGICTCTGRVSKRYFERRYGLTDPEPKPGRRASA